MPTSKTNIHKLFKGIDSEMELLLALGEHVATELDIDVLLQLVADSARQVIDAETLVVPIIDQGKNNYNYRSAAGKNAELIRNQSFPLQTGMCGWVLSNERPLLFGINNDLPMGNKTVWEEGMQSALLVPLISRGKIIGGLSGLGKVGNKSFTQRDLELLTLFANQTSVAVENAQILKQLNQKQSQLSHLLDTTRFEKQIAEVTLEAISDGVIITDTHGRIININSAAEALCEFKQQDSIGKAIDKLVTVDNWSEEETSHPLLQALHHDSMVRIPSGSITSPNKKKLQIEGSVSIMRDESFHAIGAVMLFRDVTHQRRMVEKIHNYATYDQLTGLINRREFENRLKNALKSAIHQNKNHALCYLDLDQFKIVNDTCGHAAGDELLRQLSALLSKRLRERDTLGRIGGDEFGLLLENCPLENALNIAEELREIIDDFRFSFGNQVFRIGASIGLVLIDRESTTVNALLGAADQACYAAKEQGRNRVKIYTESDEHLAIRSSEMHWVSRLHEALALDRFELYFQPIINTQSGSRNDTSYYEILIRLRDADNRLLPPGAFLPAAERYGLMVLIDKWVVKTYFSWLSKNPKHCSHLQQCSINLSGQSLSDHSLQSFIFEQLELHKVPANKLCFEITETAAIANLSDALKFMAKMHAIGVKFALDDFGTGMSSFSYLKELPIDTIKIDGSFIKDVLTDKIDLSLVSAIVDISKNMQKKTVAEYVESDEILACIRELGVDFAQGYGIAKPKPLKDILDK